MIRKTILALAGLGLLVASLPVVAQTGPIRKPITNFVNAQGTRTAGEWEDILGSPFIVNYVAWTGREAGNPTSDINWIAIVDYAGLESDADISGGVIERELDDGRIEVHVTLRATNVLTYVKEITFTDEPPFVSFGDTIFGPTTGSAVLEAIYVTSRSVRDPMNDLVSVIFEGLGDLKVLNFYATADGALSDGTSAHMTVIETGLIGPGTANGFKGALGDSFPVETIILQPVGD